MNTTKDECDGWNGISHKAPFGIQLLVIDKNHNKYLAYQCTGGDWLKWDTHVFLKDLTHWRELPEPPKPKDAFEAWWHNVAGNCQSARIDGTNGNSSSLYSDVARYIWEAAINSTKQC